MFWLNHVLLIFQFLLFVLPKKNLQILFPQILRILLHLLHLRDRPGGVAGDENRKPLDESHGSLLGDEQHRQIAKALLTDHGWGPAHVTGKDAQVIG